MFYFLILYPHQLIPVGSKFPGNPDATRAFQKVAVAYDVLSKPSLKRTYDARSSDSTYNVFASHTSTHADETFKGVVIGVFNDFLDGDLEVIKSLLSVYQHQISDRVLC